MLILENKNSNLKNGLNLYRIISKKNIIFQVMINKILFTMLTLD